MRVARDRCGRATRALVLTSLILLAPPIGRAHGRLLQVIDDPSASMGGEFGQALVAVGPDLAVGAPGAQVFDHAGAGVVRLYTAGGVLLRTLEAQNPASDAGFGTMLAASGGVLYVGAPGDPSTGVGAIRAGYVLGNPPGGLARRLPAAGARSTTGPADAREERRDAP